MAARQLLRGCVSTVFILERLFRYCSVGLFVFLIQEAVLWAFQHWTHLGARLSFWAAWVPSVTLHFFLTKYFTFRKRDGDLPSQMFRYGCVLIFTTSLQFGTYHLAQRFLTEQPNLAFAFAVLTGFSVNSLVIKRGVFERHRHGQKPERLVDSGREVTVETT